MNKLKPLFFTLFVICFLFAPVFKADAVLLPFFAPPAAPTNMDEYYAKIAADQFAKNLSSALSALAECAGTDTFVGRNMAITAAARSGGEKEYNQAMVDLWKKHLELSATCYSGYVYNKCEISCTKISAPTCSSFAYSDWSLCDKNGLQFRNVISVQPEGCTGGNSILNKACIYQTQAIIVTSSTPVLLSATSAALLINDPFIYNSRETELVATSTVANTQIKQPLFTKDLKFGTKNEDVKKLQNILKKQGFFKTMATGYYGSVTVKSVKAYQAKNKLKATGVLDRATRERIGQ